MRVGPVTEAIASQRCLFFPGTSCCCAATLKFGRFFSKRTGAIAVTRYKDGSYGSGAQETGAQVFVPHSFRKPPRHRLAPPALLRYCRTFGHSVFMNSQASVGSWNLRPRPIVARSLRPKAPLRFAPKRGENSGRRRKILPNKTAEDF